MKLEQPGHSYPRKFTVNPEITDFTGGSSPAFVPSLVMAYRYFSDSSYLDAAERVMSYMEDSIIGPSDYFSSTLDAFCEDKEASLYTATACYYMALVSEGEKKAHYTRLAKEASAFALLYYYVWDVPFAPGQMLGDLGLKSRGWGNVSVENNHIDVYLFEFADVLNWLAEETGNSRLEEFAGVIRSSMHEQLLPQAGYLCGIARPGYHPEVVQHTNWDYGRNGKGFYNNIFAPGWVVASLWEMHHPGRTGRYFSGM